MKKLIDYLPEFFEAVKAQLEKDELRWGDTWRKRPFEGHEQRTKACFDNYFDQFNATGVPVPWEKVVGNAFISWVQEKEHKAK